MSVETKCLKILADRAKEFRGPDSFYLDETGQIAYWNETDSGPTPTQAELDAITDQEAQATLDQIAETNEKENAKLDIDKRFIRALITVMEQRHREQGNWSPAQWRNRIRAAIDNG